MIVSLVVCSQSSFYVAIASQDDKNRQKTLFFAQKLNLVPKKQLLLIVPFQSTEFRRKKLRVDNKIQSTIEDKYCPTYRNEQCVYFSSNEKTSFYDCKKCKARCHLLKIPFNDQKPTIVLLGGDSTPCFARKTSCDYEKQEPSPFLKIFSANHNQAHLNLNQKW